jgi:hypothetical protein
MWTFTRRYGHIKFVFPRLTQVKILTLVHKRQFLREILDILSNGELILAVSDTNILF